MASRRWPQVLLSIFYDVLIDKTVSSFWKAYQINKLISAEIAFSRARRVYLSQE